MERKISLSDGNYNAAGWSVEDADPVKILMDAVQTIREEIDESEPIQFHLLPPPERGGDYLGILSGITV